MFSSDVKLEKKIKNLVKKFNFKKDFRYDDMLTFLSFVKQMQMEGIKYKDLSGFEKTHFENLIKFLKSD